MLKKIGKTSYVLQNPIYIESTGLCVGPEEKKGPLGYFFSRYFHDLYGGYKSFELAERGLMLEAVDECFKKRNIAERDIDAFLAGDLLFHNGTSSYVARELAIPYMGMASACSTITEAMIMAAFMLQTNDCHRVLVAVSSHFGSAERQFRYPPTFGAEKKQTANTTATGAGAAIISKTEQEVMMTAFTMGQVQDMNQTDPSQMGSIMAPAAVHTMLQCIKDYPGSLNDFDWIVTGDLGRHGSVLFRTLLLKEGIDVEGKHVDCGMLLLHPERKYYAGASGCATPALVMFSYFFEHLKQKKMTRILFLATGTLLNAALVKQGESIPAISHAIVLERREEG
ncbi:beta-ketoacyl-[acyl-carrier-protein] synthase family protein [Massilibacterium senegalense]|uniref:hypothetical protein n=1 Tax=Massilibacterium senegalense TaxID=1632858 RepID=UPI00078194B6|nr:hypothetical protein [Massilibacterium senegalense]